MTSVSSCTRGRSNLALILLAALFLLLPTAGNATSPQARPTQLKAVVTPNLNNAPFFIALEEEYFTEQGVDVELVRLPTTSTALPALINGEVDMISSVVYPSLFNAER